jgi:AcrR family transcriptional regulator
VDLRDRKRLVVWRAIRTAALELFTELGFDGVNVEQIAARAGVSRATFFNYFASKEAVVFDQDPEARDDWLSLMADRPSDEPLWDSLVAILTAFSHELADRLPIQRQLKAASPALAQSTQDFGNAFRADLEDWAKRRSRPGEELQTALQLAAAQAALSAAYRTWGADEDVTVFLDRVSTSLRLAGDGMATLHSATDQVGSRHPEG